MSSEKANKRAAKKMIMAQISALEIEEERGGPSNAEEIRRLGAKLDLLSNEFENEGYFGRRSDRETLTRSYYAIAEENGIGINTLQDRFYNRNWTAKKSSTYPVPRYNGIEQSGMTREIYLMEKKKFVIDKQIAKNFNLSMTTLEVWKAAEGVSRKARKQKGEFN